MGKMERLCISARLKEGQGSCGLASASKPNEEQPFPSPTTSPLAQDKRKKKKKIPIFQQYLGIFLWEWGLGNKFTLKMDWLF